MFRSGKDFRFLTFFFASENTDDCIVSLLRLVLPSDLDEEEEAEAFPQKDRRFVCFVFNTIVWFQ